MAGFSHLAEKFENKEKDKNFSVESEYGSIQAQNGQVNLNSTQTQKSSQSAAAAVNESVEIYECDYCPFETNEKLERHQHMAVKHEMCCICDQKWTFHPNVEGSGIFNHLEDRHYFKVLRCENCSFCCLTANALNLHETWMCIGIDSAENTLTSIESKKSTVGRNAKKSTAGTNAKKSGLEKNAKSSTVGKNAKNTVKPKVAKHRGKSSQKDGKTVSPSNDFSESSSEPQIVNKLSCLRCSEKFTVQELRRHYAKCYATEQKISPTVPEESDAIMSSASGSNIGTVGNSAAILSHNNMSPSIAKGC